LLCHGGKCGGKTGKDKQEGVQIHQMSI